RAARFSFFRSSLSVTFDVSAMNVSVLSWFKMCGASLQSFKLGKLLHQLLHAVLLKLYCNLRVIPFALTTKYRPDPVFRMPHPRALLQPCLPLRRGDLQPRPARRSLLSSRGEEARNIVHRAGGGNCIRALSESRVDIPCRRPCALVLILIVV